MFTGLIEDVGRIVGWQRHGKGARLTVETALDVAGEVVEGDSIAINGVCLTALGLSAHRFGADLSQETIDRSSFAEVRVGDAVNLERALRLGDRLGGHIVQGHVDGVGRLVSRTAVGDSWDIRFELTEALLDTVVLKGSIALDGVSLTVATLEGREVGIAVIPHTGAKTTLLTRPIGATVNVETDVLGKYVLRALSRMGGAHGSAAGRAAGAGEREQKLTLERLRALGFA